MSKKPVLLLVEQPRKEGDCQAPVYEVQYPKGGPRLSLEELYDALEGKLDADIHYTSSLVMGE